MNIDFVTIATTGNSTDFGGDILRNKSYASTASPTRVVWFGGLGNPGGNQLFNKK